MAVQNKPKESFITRLVTFSKAHPVLTNIIYVVIAAFIVVWLLLCFLDYWTNHGDEATVPTLKGQSIELASMTLENDGFKWEIMDSVFESTQRPGTIVEQTPSGGARVKPGRTVYLTIVAFTPKMVTVPNFMNVSRRQGESMFEGLGLKVTVMTVASQYKDLVLGAKVNGVPLRPGQRIPVNTNVTLEVGGGTDSEFTDDDFDFNTEPTSSAGTDKNAAGNDDDDATIQMLLQD